MHTHFPLLLHRKEEVWFPAAHFRHSSVFSAPDSIINLIKDYGGGQVGMREVWGRQLLSQYLVIKGVQWVFKNVVSRSLFPATTLTN